MTINSALIIVFLCGFATGVFLTWYVFHSGSDDPPEDGDMLFVTRGLIEKLQA